MTLPVHPTIAPMLAKAVGSSVPTGDFLYEPKWDGFRIILFKDGDEVIMQSRDEKDLSYCFPELVQAAQRLLPKQLVLDGELVIIRDGHLQFAELGNRIRPRSEAGGKKIAALAKESPVEFIAFDILFDGQDNLMSKPMQERRDVLVRMMSTVPAPFHVTSASRDLQQAQVWFDSLEGAGLDGVICKPLDQPYSPGARTMFKVKHERTIDVVVAGWREHKNTDEHGAPMVGALLLGLYDKHGRLHNVGSSSAFAANVRADMAALLSQLHTNVHPWLVGDADSAREAGQRIPGAQSRWTGKKDLSFHAITPSLVAEVRYDHLEGQEFPRFRHSARFVRWRPDRTAESCTYDQLEVPSPFDVREALARLG